MTVVVLASCRVQELRHMHACNDGLPSSRHPTEASVDGQAGHWTDRHLYPIDRHPTTAFFFVCVYAAPGSGTRGSAASRPCRMRTVCAVCSCVEEGMMSQGSWPFTTASNNQQTVSLHFGACASSDDPTASNQQSSDSLLPLRSDSLHHMHQPTWLA